MIILTMPEGVGNRFIQKILIYYLPVIYGVFFLWNIAYSAPAAPIIHTRTQPEGFTFEAKQWGDEWSHGWETLDGYSILFDEDLKSWTYAAHHPDGAFVSSLKIVGKHTPPIQVPKNIRPISPFRRMSPLKGPLKGSPIEGPQRAVPSKGAVNIPVILINFNDKMTAYASGDFNTLLFGTGNHSLKDYYEEVSYGAYTVSAGPAGVVGWYQASNTHDYYGADVYAGSNKFDAWPGDLVHEAVVAADAEGFNFAPYDNDGDCYVDVVAIVHQGASQAASGVDTDIWSHWWTLNYAETSGRSHYGEYTTNSTCLFDPSKKVKVNDYIILPETKDDGMTTIGVFAHEYGHALGLPDLYDIDTSSQGIGNWSLMAGGMWNYVSEGGDRPAHPDAWCKVKLGWVTPTNVLGTLTNEPISPAATTADVYQLLNGNPSTGGEYFLVENRQKTGFDIGLPGSGLLIWHIDESKGSNNEECYPGGTISCATNHYHVALIQADNLWELEKGKNRGNAGDPFPGSTGNTSFTAFSSPNSNFYDGNGSSISITSISASGSPMTANFCILPDAPSNPSPLDHATDISITPTLSWASSHVDTYDVYFGTSSDPPLLIANKTSNYHDLGTLNYGTTYYWKIVSKTGCGAASGSTWSFTTFSDTHPPSNPNSPATETHGVVNNIWQNSVSGPIFTWSGATDDVSGVKGYYWYFGTDANANPATWTATAGCSPTGVSSGTYYLRVKTEDNAGNQSSPVTLFTFRYDSSVPSNPTSCNEIHGVTHDTWQNAVSIPSFNWSGALDNVSGIKGYSWYFGTNPLANPTNWTTTAGCNSSWVSSGTYYLRVNTEDNAGNQSYPVTLFTFKYDGTPPTSGSISINNGALTTLSLMVSLSNLGATDMNGLSLMKFSNNPSVSWTSPEPYTSTKADWDLASFGGNSAPGQKTVFVKYQDNVGNWSDPFPSQICYQPLQPFPFKDDFSMEKGWFGYESGSWERGAAKAGGGESGYPDPGEDYSLLDDRYIMGFAIGADYPNDLVEKSIISPPIDCTEWKKVFLKFRRHLNVEGNRYDHARIFVSTDGMDWTEVWENPPIDLMDSQWVPFVLDISSVAANQATVYIKFTMGPTDFSIRFSGWNIDDLEVTSEALYPSEGTYGTEIGITGTNFGTKKGKVFIGSTSLKVLDWTTGNLIKSLLNKTMEPKIYDVTMQPKEGDPIIYENAFILRPAEIHSMEQVEGTSDDEITIKGKFFGSKKGKVYLEYEDNGIPVSKSCKVTQWWMDPLTNESEIYFIVPKMAPEVCDVVVDPYSTLEEVEEEEGFEVRAPEIESVNPEFGSLGEKITISGNYFGSKRGKVYLGYMSKGKSTKKSCSIISWENDEIVFVVPNLPSESYNVIVTNSVESATLYQGFVIK